MSNLIEFILNNLYWVSFVLVFISLLTLIKISKGQVLLKNLMWTIVLASIPIINLIVAFIVTIILLGSFVGGLIAILFFHDDEDFKLF